MDFADLTGLNVEGMEASILFSEGDLSAWALVPKQRESMVPLVDRIMELSQGLTKEVSVLLTDSENAKLNYRDWQAMTTEIMTQIARRYWHNPMEHHELIYDWQTRGELQKANTNMDVRFISQSEGYLHRDPTFANIDSLLETVPAARAHVVVLNREYIPAQINLWKNKHYPESKNE